jgi:hypothetical protein
VNRLSAALSSWLGRLVAPITSILSSEFVDAPSNCIKNYVLSLRVAELFDFVTLMLVLTS